ncbi:hypothetical protein ACFRAU_22230 [Arthrobacter sp. NPDC056691]|uniref:hypothetical protein n=1 Tax=Arthrobacter sp. NPDC056691 TaxID=3345913 RepID=UPI00366BAAF0
MVTVSREFFQAGATAIPAILIALAVGAKQGIRWAQDLQGKSRLGRVLVIMIVLFCILAVLGGEAVALVTLLTQNYTVDAANLVWSGLMIGLLVLITELIRPVSDGLPKRERPFLLVGAILIWVLINVTYIGGLYFLYFK